MSALADFYPPAPIGVPEDFTKPGKAFVWRVTFLLLGLIGFLILYLTLIAVTAYGTYFLITNPPTNILNTIAPLNKKSIRLDLTIYMIWIGLNTILITLCFIFLNGLFKKRTFDWSNFIELRRDEQPRLFAFIDKLCEETRAPRPNKVFMGNEINAAITCDSSLLNLVLPPRIYLIIGAGLVESINLREFKATLAHEFGHFSQNCPSLGRYAFRVNNILGDMIYSQDGFDRFLTAWSKRDYRLSFPAWGLMGIVWILRKGLGAVYKGINRKALPLSMQKEFNADDVAVSVAGSDAIVEVIWKANQSENHMGIAIPMLKLATKQGLFTNDIHYHQTEIISYFCKVTKDEKWGVPPKSQNGGQSAKDFRVFGPAMPTIGIPKMWLDHPPNLEREQNAKRIYLAVHGETHPAWYIFNNIDHLKKDLSLIYYKLALGKDLSDNLVDAKEVQVFIDQELLEHMTYPKYRHIYAKRWMRLEEFGEWEQEASINPQTPETIRAFLDDFPSRAMYLLGDAWAYLSETSELLGEIISNDSILERKTFHFRGNEYKPEELNTLLIQVNQELDNATANITTADKEVFINHYHAAMNLDPEKACELCDQYRFQSKLIVWGLQFNQLLVSINPIMKHFEADTQFSNDDTNYIRGLFNLSRTTLIDAGQAMSSVICPNLSSVKPGIDLQSYIFNDTPTLGPPLPQKGPIPTGWVKNHFLILRTASDNLGTIQSKSKGSILLFQEEIAREYLAKTAGESAQNPESTAPVPEGTSTA